MWSHQMRETKVIWKGPIPNFFDSSVTYSADRQWGFILKQVQLGSNITSSLVNFELLQNLGAIFRQ